MREIDDIQRRNPDAPWIRPPNLGRTLTQQWITYNQPQYHWLKTDQFIRWLAAASAKASATSGDGTT
jgi:hypothetical protein